MSHALGHATAKSGERLPVRPVMSARRSEPVQGAGNQQMQALLRGGWLRPKLELGGLDDPEEREADAVADRVMRSADGGCCAACAEGGTCEQPTLRRQPDGGRAPSTVPRHVEPRLRGLADGGEPLAPALRAFFEPRFGRDLSSIRIHRDGEAQTAARAIGAQAFTLGSHIGIGAGYWAPDKPAGRRLLAHELTHTGQPRRAVRRQPAPLWQRASVTPLYARNLSESQLRQQLSAARLSLALATPGTPEHLSLAQNVETMAAIAGERGIEAGGAVPGRIGAGLPLSFPVTYVAEPLDTGMSVAGRGLASAGLASHIFAAGDFDWLTRGPGGQLQSMPRSTMAARLFRPSFWRPFVPRPGMTELERIVGSITPSQFEPKVLAELAELRAGTRSALSYATNYQIPEADVLRVPELIRAWNRGTISPTDLAVLRRIADLHIGGGTQGSPLASLMQPNFPLDTFPRPYRIRVEMPRVDVLDVSGPNPFNEMGVLDRINNAAEGELMVAQRYADRVIAVERLRVNGQIPQVDVIAMEAPAGFALRHLGAVRWAGRGVFVLGLGISGARIGMASPEERPRVIAEEAGGQIGGGLGTAAGAGACVLFGIATSGLGLLLCGIGGGIIGGLAGSAAGGALVDTAERSSGTGTPCPSCHALQRQWAEQPRFGGLGWTDPGTVPVHDWPAAAAQNGLSDADREALLRWMGEP